jgi:putative transposase
MITYSYKLYKDKKNKHLHHLINVAGCVYNHCIALHKRYYRLYKKNLSSYALKKHLTKLKKQDRCAFFNDLGSQAIQDVVERIDRAYRLFFKGLKVKKRVSFPSFCKVKKYHSFTLKSPAGFSFQEGNRLRIGKRIYKFSLSRSIEGKIKTLTIKRNSLGELFIYVSCDVQNEVLAMTGKSAGFDFGLKDFLVSDQGEVMKAPLPLKKSLKELKQRSKKLSSKLKGSNNRLKARKALCRVHLKVVNTRKDFAFKLSKRLCETYDKMYLEDLELRGMQRLYGRKIGDLGFANFKNILASQAKKCGKELHFIPRFYPSSKTCSSCLKVKKELSLKERTFKCEHCNVSICRDHNAAKNILRVGASTRRLDLVRPVAIQAKIV